MEPVFDLSVLNSWSDYRPSTAGYAEAPKDELLDADGLFDSLEDLEGDKTLVGQSIWQDSPNPGAFVRGESLEVPLSPSAWPRIVELENGSKQERSCVYQFQKEEVRTCNPSWARTVNAGVMKALSSLTNKDIPIVCHQADMVLITADCTQLLDMRQVSEHHFATALVVLPSYITSSSVTLEARHGHLAHTHTLGEVDPFATRFVVLYAGMDRTMLKATGGPICYLTYYVLSDSDSRPALRNLTGPREDISKAFAAWRMISRAGTQKQKEALPMHILYQLDGRYAKKQLSIANINHPADKLVLGHLAPPARHYGFRILFAQVCVHLRATLQILNEGSDDSDGVDYDDYTPDDFTLKDNWDEDAEALWKFTSFDGTPIEVGCEDRLYEDIERRNIYNCRIDLQDEAGKGLDVDWDGDREYLLPSVSYTKRASFILIIPEREPLGPHDPSQSETRTGAATSIGDPGQAAHEASEAVRDLSGVGQKRKRF